MPDPYVETTIRFTRRGPAWIASAYGVSSQPRGHWTGALVLLSEELLTRERYSELDDLIVKSRSV